MEQVKCKLCKTKRELKEEELKEIYDVIERKKLERSALFDILNIYDGKTCPEGGTHEYDWNQEFFQKMLDDSTKIKENNAQIVRNHNENREMESKIKQLKIDTENKIKEMTEEMTKNKESNTLMEQSNTEIKDNILKTSGKEWNSWL